MEKFPCSGEINSTVDDVKTVLSRVEQAYLPLNPDMNKIDGLSMDFGKWRFNLRGSNTELLMAGKGAESLVSRAFQVEVKDGVAVLPGVVSRKKQFIPAMMSAYQEL